jgi:hypothetical protein
VIRYAKQAILKGKKKMFIIKEYHIHENWSGVLHKTESAAEAYEKAHQFMAANYDCTGPRVVQIEDENGIDMWRYCAGIRCPTGKRKLL